MSLAADVLDDDALRAAAEGFELDVHLTWYRSLPLSSVRAIDVVVNGDEAHRDDVTFVLAGRAYALDDLERYWDETWFVLDPATLRVRGPSVVPGDDVDVTVRLRTRIPYVLVGPDQALEVQTVASRRLTAR